MIGLLSKTVLNFTYLGFSLETEKYYNLINKPNPRHELARTTQRGHDKLLIGLNTLY